ncbi:peptidase M14 [Shewanella sp. WXL01]|uniref:M14 family zinc carboxypeptidase n=1 Tax=Shewanella sp. WXL01 TaxID=2709721 RepID=UPI00143846E6|nr:M14 family zinc carboxypeptidase [Shewanella sp. WXL01]NKF52128.1 peptidase M14 [Shewanella sp. WXL01]
MSINLKQLANQCISHVIRSFFAVTLLFGVAAVQANSDTRINQLLANSAIDQTITTPEQHLGYSLGEWHLRHDQINQYLRKLDEQSERTSLDTAGFSAERREQLSLVLTSKSNQQNLAQILAQRAKVKQGDESQAPLVIWLAYSIHGDEPSGAHAAMAISHYLTASNDAWVKQLLEQAIVLITPVQNPDGFDRFSTWANNHRGQTLVSDPQHREHKQNWPSGRGNHYWADMNRDWLFLRHDSSQGRVAFFHKWQPHLVGDFHEMGHNRSYFFQPGVPTRVHPLTQDKNQQLTNELANFHRKALDEVKQVYFSKQRFDDFFYGKGSTYPDINGAIGVLFEQASARGQQQHTDSGLLTFSHAIDNQFTTSISSLKGAMALKTKLVDYQRDFYQGKQTKTASKPKGRLVSTKGDSLRLIELANLLEQHQIQFHYLKQTQQHAQHQYLPQDSLFIPVKQPQSDLVKALFDKRTEFEDATFYDVSSWDMSAAFDLASVTNVAISQKQLTDTLAPWSSATEPWRENTVALLIDWQQSGAAMLVSQLHKAKIKVKFASQPFAINTAAGERSFGAGTLQIPVKQPELTSQALLETVAKLVDKQRLEVVAVTTAMANTNMDLGSDDFKYIAEVKPLLITGRSVSSTESGEIWYYMDKTLGQPLSMINADRLLESDLSRYSHIYIADGSLNHFGDQAASKLERFVKDGGVIVAQKRALRWLDAHNLLDAKPQSTGFYRKLFDTEGLNFNQRSELRAKQSIGGAIVSLDLDLSHPINFGLSSPLSVLKNRPMAFSTVTTPFTLAASYSDNVLKSGYMAKEYQGAFSNQGAIVVERKGKGAVVALSDNLVFRNIWLGSEKIYANALYFMPGGLR